MKVPTHTLHRITLELRVPRDGVTDYPENWDWATLLDLPDTDDVKVISSAVGPFTDEPA